MDPFTEAAYVPSTMTLWLTQYGSFALFVLLALGIFALPIPDETLMLIAGGLIAHDKLYAFPTFAAALLGAMLGITISYLIGRTAGALIIDKYGHWVHITPARMKRVHNFFERFGRWAVLIGYFIPGIRHLTGYAAGITKMEYKHFALFAYVGATIWVALFLSAGYFVGDRIELIEAFVIKHWPYIAGVVGVLIIAGVGFVVWRKRAKKKLVSHHRDTESTE